MTTKILAGFALFLSSAFAVATTATTAPPPAQEWLANIAFGPSVPQTDAALGITQANTSFQAGGGPSRISGGEKFTVQFVGAKNHKPVTLQVNGVRLAAFSKNGQGKVLIHRASPVPKQAPSLFDPLVYYSAASPNDNVEDYRGNIMIPAGGAAHLSFAKPLDLSELNFVLESFGSDDTSLVIQFEWTAAIPNVAEEVSRVVLANAWVGGGSSTSGGVTSGGDDQPICQSSGQCPSSLYQCLNGQCLEITSNACDNAAHECASGETCCSGTCKTGGSIACD